MDYKELVYKVIKGAVGGAAASLATLSLVGMPVDKMGPILVATAIGGALHGIANALEQKKG